MTNRTGLFRLLLPVVSTLIAVGLVELILMLFYPIPYSMERNMYFEADPYLGYRHRPMSSGYYPNGVAAEANSLGFRDDDTTLAKPPGTFRILVLGDSFTVGANVEQADVYPQVLERLLDDNTAQRIEVINAGVGGYDTFHYATFVEQYADDFNPDLLLLGFFVGNDTYSAVRSAEQTRTAVLGRRVARDIGKGWAIVAKVWGYEHLNVVRALINRGPAQMQFARERCDEFSPIYLRIQATRIDNHRAEQSAEQRDLFAGNMNYLRQMKRWADLRGVPFLVVLLPDENQINEPLQQLLVPEGERDDFDFEMPQKLLRPGLEEAGIAYLDLLSTFRKDSRCLYMDDTHWIDTGHALAAREIAAMLTQGSWLKQQ